MATAIYILNAMSPVLLDQTMANMMVDIATTMVGLYPTIPAERRELAKALYAGHLLHQNGVLAPTLSENFDGGSVSFQAFNLGDKDGSSTWLQEFTKLIPDFHSPDVIL